MMRTCGTRWLGPGIIGTALVLASCQAPARRQPGAAAAGGGAITVAQSPYGTLPDGRPVHLYTLQNGRGMRVQLTDYGATTVSVEVPDRQGASADITLGHADLAGWLSDAAYFGATIGRCANRIARGEFTLDGRTYTLAVNNGPNHLHGGLKGFNKVLWNAEPFQTAGEAGVRFTYLSPDGEEGYPGNLSVTAAYSITDRNEFKAEFSATTDAATVVNLAHHTYWNLAGPAAGEVLGHELMLAADLYTVSDSDLIPTGELAPVAGTPLDFTAPTAIGARIDRVPGGYDQNFALRSQTGDVALAARVHEPKTGRVMEIFTDQPGIQFYSGNFLDGTVTGKDGVVYRKHFGFCLETQHYPDSPNHPQFPSVALRPGETYRHTMIHRFSTQ